MVIKIARYAGFCQGVKRAIDTALDVGEKYANAVTLGPIVHNQFVVDYLADHGVGVINSTDDFDRIASDTAVVLRSHGIAKAVYDLLDDKNIEYIDATCPFVKAVHKLAHKAHSEKKNIIIVGDPKHPEVIGIKGWTDDQGYIVNTIQDIEDLPTLSGEIVVVAQTTQTGENWQQITDRLRQMYPKIKTYNTICKATSERQTSAIELAREVDVMLVVGSFSSSNTKKLTQVCQEQGAITYQIESRDDIKKEWFSNQNMKIGITAGASTPDWVLKEVVQMVEEMQGTVDEMKVLTKGDILKATVTQVEDNQVTVDIGYKYDGVVPIGEISSLHIETAHNALKVGDEIQVEVLKINDEKGKMILSKKSVDSRNAWQNLKLKFENNETLEVVVADVVKGGLVVDIGVRGFIPASHVERHFVEDFSDYKGRTLKVKIIEFDPENNKVILSQKHVLDEEAGNNKVNALNNLKVGSIIEGTVQRLTDFGAFVDVGGIDGLIHVSELAWQRVDKPSDVVKEGDKVTVKILNVDAENGRVSLSLKSALPSPWEAIRDLKQGDITEGIVKRLVSFGAFVELKPGVEGLVHISEISDRHIGTPGDALEVGQKVSVKILEVNIEDKRISLSIRQTLEPKPVPEKVSIEYTKDNELNTYTLGEMIGDKLKNFKN